MSNKVFKEGAAIGIVFGSAMTSLGSATRLVAAVLALVLLVQAYR